MSKQISINQLINQLINQFISQSVFTSRTLKVCTDSGMLADFDFAKKRQTCDPLFFLSVQENQIHRSRAGGWEKKEKKEKEKKSKKKKRKEKQKAKKKKK